MGLNCAVLMVIVSATAVAQNENTDILPLPLVNPHSAAPNPNRPGMTPREKAELAYKNTFGPRAIGNRLVSAGLDQWRGHPHEWGGGVDAFGTRFSSRMGRLAIRNSVRLATDVAFGIDPRYDRCLCDGFWARTGHAWKRVVVSRSDSGSEMPALSNFTGAYVTPYLTYTWYPERLDTWNRKLESGTIHLGWRGATNMMREFWPEIKRGLTFYRR